jgi:hypothetical protein
MTRLGDIVFCRVLHAQRPHTRALRADARGGDGGVREILAARAVANV